MKLSRRQRRELKLKSLTPHQKKQKEEERDILAGEGFFKMQNFIDRGRQVVLGSLTRAPIYS